MDINIVGKNLKKIYNCELICIINYANCHFVKALETFEDGISYRYFKIDKNNELKEIKDEILLSYFKEKNEINSDINY